MLMQLAEQAHGPLVLTGGKALCPGLGEGLKGKQDRAWCLSFRKVEGWINTVVGFSLSLGMMSNLPDGWKLEIEWSRVKPVPDP